MDAITAFIQTINNGVVSIHAPVMDAMLLLLEIDSLKCFNPRARDGRDKSSIIKTLAT